MIEADMPLWLIGHAWNGKEWSPAMTVAIGNVDHAYADKEGDRNYVEFVTGRGAVWRCYLDNERNHEIILGWMNGE